jgi:hypothetical protein
LNEWLVGSAAVAMPCMAASSQRHGKTGAKPWQCWVSPAPARLQVKEDVLDFCLLDERLRAFSLPTPPALAAYRVVVCSCSASGGRDIGAPAVFFSFFLGGGRICAAEGYIRGLKAPA